MHTSERSKLRALSDIASIDITLEFDKILQNILEITCKTIDAHSGTIMLVDGCGNDLRMVASYGLPNNYIERVYEAAKKTGVPISSSPSGTVLETGGYYLVPNVNEEPKDKPWLHLAVELGFSSQIFTPMKIGSKVIGLLNVYMAQVQQFTEEEIDFVTIAASQATSVVQNARICCRLKNNIQKLKEYKEHLEEKIHEAHKELFDSERYLRAVIDSSLDGIAVVNDRGIFEFGNDSFFNIIGWTRDELIGQYFMKVIPEDTKELILGHWQSIQNLNDPGGLNEVKIKTGSGEIRCLHVSTSLTEIRGKKKVIASILDISEKKKLEINIKESEARHRELFENAIDAIFTQDLEGRILTMNNAWLKIIGCTIDEVTGSHFSKWIAPDSLKKSQEILTRSLSGEVITKPTMIEMICKNGERKWVEFTIRLIKEGDRITGIHGTGRDVTENKRLKQELKESNKQLKLLWYLIVGTRGGNTRALILKHLIDKPHNANQLADALNMDYKTVRHHLDVLVKNGIITKEKSNGYTTVYFPSKNIGDSLLFISGEGMKFKPL